MKQYERHLDALKFIRDQSFLEIRNHAPMQIWYIESARI